MDKPASSVLTTRPPRPSIYVCPDCGGELNTTGLLGFWDLICTNHKCGRTVAVWRPGMKTWQERRSGAVVLACG